MAKTTLFCFTNRALPNAAWHTAHLQEGAAVLNETTEARSALLGGPLSYHLVCDSYMERYFCFSCRGTLRRWRRSCMSPKTGCFSRCLFQKRLHCVAPGQRVEASELRGSMVASCRRMCGVTQIRSRQDVVLIAPSCAPFAVLQPGVGVDEALAEDVSNPAGERLDERRRVGEHGDE
eukprot:scaffold320_cov367-Pinguiococcus_pyrenoidosus.AAC.6